MARPEPEFQNLCAHLRGRTFDPSSFVSASIAKQKADVPPDVYILQNEIEWVIAGRHPLNNATGLFANMLTDFIEKGGGLIAFVMNMFGGGNGSGAEVPTR